MFDISKNERQKTLHVLKEKKLLIIGRLDAPTDYLAAFLREKAKEVTVIRFKPDAQKNIPFLFQDEYINSQKLSDTKKIRFIFKTTYLPFNVVILLSMYIYTIFYILFIYILRGPFHVVIGLGPFNGWTACISKGFSNITKTVYYAEDNVSYLGDNLQGKLIKWCDFSAKKYSTAIWFISKKHLMIYKEKYILKKSFYIPEPIISLKKNPSLLTKRIVFIGGVSREQGLDMLYRVFRRLTEKFHDVTLLVIGDGEYKKEMEKKAQKDGLDRKIEFKGFIVDRNTILSLISESYLGIAFYNPYLYPNLAYGQSSKISNYIGCGLPVITTGSKTNMPSFAEHIRKYNVGYALSYNEDEIYNQINLLFTDKSLYSKMSSNTKKVTDIFNKDKIYTYAFHQLLSLK